MSGLVKKVDNSININKISKLPLNYQIYSFVNL